MKTVTEGKKELYYLRKIDDLGRITIPRHIRDIANIHNGDSLELSCLDDGQIVIRKHEIRKYFLASTEKIIEGFHNATGFPVVLCDRNEIVFSKGMSKIKCKDLSNDFFAQIRRMDNNVYPNIYLNADKSIKIKNFKFIVHGGECIGAVVIPESDIDMTDEINLAIDVCASAITAYVAERGE